MSNRGAADLVTLMTKVDSDEFRAEITRLQTRLAELEQLLSDQLKERARLRRLLAAATGLLAARERVNEMESEDGALPDQLADMIVRTGDRELLFEVKAPLSAAAAVRNVMEAFPSVEEWRADDILNGLEKLGWRGPTSKHSVQVALSRLERKGELERIRQGAYRRPRGVQAWTV